MEPHRIGLIGVGRWARETHLPNLAQMEDVRVVALASRQPANLEAGRQLLPGGIRLFTDYQDLLAWDEVEAVLVCVPNDLHAQVTEKALRAGKHVLCEKPLGLSLEECDRVLGAQQAGQVLQVGLELRYGLLVERVRALLRRGEIGAVALQEVFLQRPSRSPQGWRADLERCGGFFYEVGCHYLDLLEVFAESPCVRVQGQGGRRLGGPLWDHAGLVVTHASGTISLFRFCTFGWHKEIVFDLLGSHGQMQIRYQDRQIDLFQRETNDRARYQVSEAVGYRCHSYDGAYESLREFVRCLRTGDRPQTDGRVGRHSVALSLACEQALQTGQTVEVKE